jgi:hypothetical protein
MICSIPPVRRVPIGSRPAILTLPRAVRRLPPARLVPAHIREAAAAAAAAAAETRDEEEDSGENGSEDEDEEEPGGPGEVPQV